MKTSVEICNDAMRILSLRPDITNIDDPMTPSEKVFAAYFSQVRRSTIKRFKPRFACVESQKINGVPIDPGNPEKGVKFILPADCLYLAKVNDSADGFTLYGKEIRLLCSGYSNTNTSITINYVRDIPETGLWTDEFDELMAARLARKCGTYLTKNTANLSAAIAEERQQIDNFSYMNAKDTHIRRKNKNMFDKFWGFPYRS